MSDDQITVSVDSAVASAYRAASDEERRKLDLLVNLRLRDATQRDPRRHLPRSCARSVPARHSGD